MMTWQDQSKTNTRISAESDSYININWKTAVFAECRVRYFKGYTGKQQGLGNNAYDANFDWHR